MKDLEPHKLNSQVSGCARREKNSLESNAANTFYTHSRTLPLSTCEFYVLDGGFIMVDRDSRASLGPHSQGLFGG